MSGYTNFRDYWHLPDKNRTEYEVKGAKGGLLGVLIGSIPFKGGTIIEMYNGDDGWTMDRGGVSEQIVVAQAQAMHSTLQSHGYTNVNIDSGWTNREDGFGRKLWNTTKFPSGIPALASRLHGMGLKLGIYLTPGISRTDVDNNVPVAGTSFHAKDFADTSGWR